MKFRALRGKVKIAGNNTLSGMPALWAALLLLAVVSFGDVSNFPDERAGANGALTLPSPANAQHADRGRQTAQKRPEAQQTAAADIRDYEASVTLIRCISAKARIAPSSFDDGGRSAAAILQEECQGEYVAYVEACIGAGIGEDICVKSALFTAQLALAQIKQ